MLSFPASMIAILAAALFNMLLAAWPPQAFVIGLYPTSMRPSSIAPFTTPVTVESTKAWFLLYSPLRLFINSQYLEAALCCSNCSNMPTRIPFAAPIVAPANKITGAAAAPIPVAAAPPAAMAEVAIPMAAPCAALLVALAAWVPIMVSCWIVSYKVLSYLLGS